jgi:hypothetical protein
MDGCGMVNTWTPMSCLIRYGSMFNHRCVFCDGWFHLSHFGYEDNIKCSIQDYLSKWYFLLQIILDLCSTERCCTKYYLWSINFFWKFACAGLIVTHLIDWTNRGNRLESGFLSFYVIFAVLWSRWVGDLPQEVLAKFGFRSQRTLEKTRNVAMCWWHVETCYSNMTNSVFFSLKIWQFVRLALQKKCCQVTKFGPQKNDD